MKNRWASVLPLLACILVLILFPAQAATGALQGLRLCGTKLIPALLPFLFLTRLLTSLLPPLRFSERSERLVRRIFGIDGESLCALLLSFLGGYPSGVSGVVGFYQSGALRKQKAENLLTFCNNSGPAFFTGVIGFAVLNSVKDGLLLYAVHCFSALLCARLFYLPSLPQGRMAKSSPRLSFAAAFHDALLGACAAMLQIAALVVLFSVPARLFSTLSGGFLSDNQLALALGLLELSGGVVRLSGETAFVLCAFLMGWGGLCVHFQAASLWQQARLQPRGYYAAKLLHGLLSGIFALALRSPSAPVILSCGSLFLFCFLYPLFSKKWGRNLSANAV